MPTLTSKKYVWTNYDELASSDSMSLHSESNENMRTISVNKKSHSWSVRFIFQEIISIPLKINEQTFIFALQPFSYEAQNDTRNDWMRRL